jgi:hypothetical protein
LFPVALEAHVCNGLLGEVTMRLGVYVPRTQLGRYMYVVKLIS